MRPTPPEAIRGLTTSLLSGILPELISPWSQSQLRNSLALLGTIAAEWDGAADNLVRENEALQQLCRSAAELAAAERGTPFTESRQTLAVAAALPPAPNLRISTLAERNGRLWQVLQPVIEAAARADGTEPWLAPIRAALQPLLRGYVAARQLRIPM